MRLKELEIQGFKSFPDRTKVTIGAGITGVVGPNGSGKSNISDAIRWRPGAQLQYAVTGEEGPDHDKTFTVEVTLDGKVLAAGTGRSKKAAEQQAACAALARLQRG